MFDFVIDQFKLHLNTQVNASDLVDALVKEIKENGQSYENAETIIESLEKDYLNDEQGINHSIWWAGDGKQVIYFTSLEKWTIQYFH